MVLPTNVSGLDPWLQKKILRWEVELYDSNWEHITPITTKAKYKFKLHIKDNYMKLWEAPEIKKQILDKVKAYGKYLYVLPDFMDNDNEINFKKFNKIYKMSNSEIKRFRDPLIEAGLIKKEDWIYYLSPLVGIKNRQEIPQHLLLLFRDTFQVYWVKLSYNENK